MASLNENGYHSPTTLIRLIYYMPGAPFLPWFGLPPRVRCDVIGSQISGIVYVVHAKLVCHCLRTGAALLPHHTSSFVYGLATISFSQSVGQRAFCRQIIIPSFGLRRRLSGDWQTKSSHGRIRSHVRLLCLGKRNGRRRYRDLLARRMARWAVDWVTSLYQLRSVVLESLCRVWEGSSSPSNRWPGISSGRCDCCESLCGGYGCSSS